MQANEREKCSRGELERKTAKRREQAKKKKKRTVPLHDKVEHRCREREKKK